jgi:hypothetical protein
MSKFNTVFSYFADTLNTETPNLAKTWKISPTQYGAITQK